MDDSASTTNSRRAIVQVLESLARSGLTELPRRAAVNRIEGAETVAVDARAAQRAQVARLKPTIRGTSGDAYATATAAAASSNKNAPGVAAPAANGAALFVAAGWDGAPRLPPEQRQQALDLICGQVKGCERCRELANTRTQTVFGVGNASARLCFMGEAPGADEDKQGEPFVGRAGQLLNKIIEACTLSRQDVFILNTIKCRPPQNRNPLPAEVTNCREYLDRQLDIIQPEFICCLGLVAAQALLGIDTSMSRLRKRFFEYRGARVLCTYHPAYLLRNSAAKKDVWEDMQLLMREMGITLPGKTS
jgi:uracil-DNA glycosylase family 4